MKQSVLPYTFLRQFSRLLDLSEVKCVRTLLCTRLWLVGILWWCRSSPLRLSTSVVRLLRPTSVGTGISLFFPFKSISLAFTDCVFADANGVDLGPSLLLTRFPHQAYSCLASDLKEKMCSSSLHWTPRGYFRVPWSNFNYYCVLGKKASQEKRERQRTDSWWISQNTIRLY